MSGNHAITNNEAGAKGGLLALVSRHQVHSGLGRTRSTWQMQPLNSFLPTQAQFVFIYSCTLLFNYVRETKLTTGERIQGRSAVRRLSRMCQQTARITFPNGQRKQSGRRH